MFQKHAFACFFLLTLIYYLHALHIMHTIPILCLSPYACHPYSMHILHYLHTFYHALHAYFSLFTYTNPMPSMPQPHLLLVYKQLWNSYCSLASLCFPINKTFFTLKFTLKATSLRTQLLTIASIVRSCNTVAAVC